MDFGMELIAYFKDGITARATTSGPDLKAAGIDNNLVSDPVTGRDMGVSIDKAVCFGKE